MFAFHLEVPAGDTSLDVSFDFLISGVASGYSSGASSTADLNDLSWNQVMLYPKGYAAKDLMYARKPETSCRMEIRHGTAEAQTNGRHDQLRRQCSLSMLVDSPVLSGRYFRVIPLTPGQDPFHTKSISPPIAKPTWR